MNLEDMLIREFRDFDKVQILDGNIYLFIGLSKAIFRMPPKEYYAASMFKMVDNGKEGKLPDLRPVKKRLEKVFKSYYEGKSQYY